MTLVQSSMTPNQKYWRAVIRIDDLGFTDAQADFIFQDWPEGDKHIDWLLGATREEITAWGEAANWGCKE